MIKHLHSKSTPSFKNRRTKYKPQNSTQGLVHQLSKELLQPREQAIQAILAKAAAMK
jgi:hypothetical protein